MLKFRFSEAKSAFKLEGFKFLVYLIVPIGIGVYYSVPDHWMQALTAHSPLETSEEAQRRQMLRSFSTGSKASSSSQSDRVQDS